jgi:hypothetical protein
MTSDGFRWTGSCTGCGNRAELESRTSHSERALCDDCAKRRPPTVDTPPMSEALAAYYRAESNGNGNSTGVAMAELVDLDPGPEPRPDAMAAPAVATLQSPGDWPSDGTTARGGHDVATVRIVTLDEFADFDEPGAAALVGPDSESALIPEGGDVMIYGDGGAGKTTLTIDLACHLGAGDPWLGIPVGRPVRVLILENEGPRPHFRAKLRRKRDHWQGSPLGDRICVLEEPWSKLTSTTTRAANCSLQRSASTQSTSSSSAPSPAPA